MTGSPPAFFTFVPADAPVTLGRDDDCSIAITGVGVSRVHARIEHRDSGWVIIDNASNCGTFINGEPVSFKVLIPGDVITIGVTDILAGMQDASLLLKIHESILAAQLATTPPTTEVAGLITLGRDSSNTLVFKHPLVSRFHARYTIIGTIAIIEDLDSANGVFVNGRRVQRSPLVDNDRVQIGPQRCVFLNGKLSVAQEGNQISLEAQGVRVVKKSTVILADVNVVIPAGEFVAILGPSGAGKSTLALALTGQIRLTGGVVLYNGIPFSQRGDVFRAHIGFVSQETLLFKELTVKEMLEGQAWLRLPRDSLAIERQERISEVMALLDIAGIAHRRIGLLSGGEAKRVHIATELLSSPSIIFLDEPLAGLDPGLVTRFMELFRTIARKGHTILLTTHTLEQVELCDRVIFVNKGRLAFNGSPAATAQHFGFGTIAPIYEKLRSEPWPRNEYVQSVAPEAALPADLPRPIASADLFRQLRVLIPRYVKILLRDIRNAGIIIAQAPLIALVLAAVYGFRTSYLPISFYFCLSIAAIWCGGMNSIREIAREWPIFDREYRSGLSPLAWIISKLVVFCSMSLIQAGLFVGVCALLFKPFIIDLPACLIVASASVAGCVMGLCISAWSGNVSRAISLLPLVFIPQIFFSGILLPFDRMPLIGNLLSRLTAARPVFVLFKQVRFLEQGMGDKVEWISLAVVTTLSIIFLYAGTLRRCYLRLRGD